MEPYNPGAVKRCFWSIRAFAKSGARGAQSLATLILWGKLAAGCPHPEGTRRRQLVPQRGFSGAKGPEPPRMPTLQQACLEHSSNPVDPIQPLFLAPLDRVQKAG